MYSIKGKCASALLTIDNLDGEAVSQLYGLLNAVSSEESEVAIMPDGHLGGGSHCIGLERFEKGEMSRFAQALQDEAWQPADGLMRGERTTFLRENNCERLRQFLNLKGDNADNQYIFRIFVDRPMHCYQKHLMVAGGIINKAVLQKEVQ